MSRNAIARILVVLSLIVMIPAGCGGDWVVDVDEWEYGDPGEPLSRLNSQVASGATFGIVALAILGLAALVTSFGAHGTNKLARYGVLSLAPLILISAIYILLTVKPPLRALGLWPGLFIDSIVILAGAVAALPSEGRLAVPDAADDRRDCHIEGHSVDAESENPL